MWLCKGGRPERTTGLNSQLTTVQNSEGSVCCSRCASGWLGQPQMRWQRIWCDATQSDSPHFLYWRACVGYVRQSKARRAACEHVASSIAAPRAWQPGRGSPLVPFAPLAPPAPFNSRQTDP